ncbi:hypothetical protein ABB37_01621 [Leptomonas pyrrhocoris]|uniref:Uncharacterized protein n=1 Tax=Leptomonas pyrrhocoris TaxID=157538 RepID=A0A0N0VHG7_LEPPY|nr:hypothetical protein ABB37_01621 [Leptomonas pyrrhocoris]KPA85278.1 hypothetical protein ABB37_01621 [Leptomonas pyrrhocoris]|eukprot:XP_015663717.1 hypothetical protein ABB37_01621 [Leptomonas pyrrhocoris]
MRRPHGFLVDGCRAAVHSSALSPSAPMPTFSDDAQQELVRLQHHSAIGVVSSGSISASWSGFSEPLTTSLSTMHTKPPLCSAASAQLFTQLQHVEGKELWIVRFAKAVADLVNTASSPQPPTMRTSVKSGGLHTNRLLAPALLSPSRNYATTQRPSKDDGVDGSPATSSPSSSPPLSQQWCPAESAPAIQRKLTSQRFCHRREKGKKRGNGAGRKADEMAKRADSNAQPPSRESNDAPQQPLSSSSPPSSAFSSRRGGQRCSSSSRLVRGPAAEPAQYNSGKALATSGAAPSRPRFLNGGRKGTQRRQLGVPQRGEGDVFTQWSDAPVVRSRKVDASRPHTTDGATPLTHNSQRSATHILQSEEATPKGTAPSATRPAPAAPTTSRSDVEWSFLQQRASPHTQPTKSAPFFAKTGKMDFVPLRKLLHNHKTFEQNFATLKRNSAVVASFERLGMEALARSGLLEALADVFTHVEEKQRASAEGAVGPEERNTGVGTAAASSSVRLVLTHLSGASSLPAASPVNDSGVEVATLEVSQRVIDWLNSPIEAPPLTAAEMMASIDDEVTVFETMRARTNDRSLRSGSTEAAPGSERKEEELTDSGALQWYAQWGRQRTELPVQDPSDAVPACSTPPVDRCMSQWYERHVLLSRALLLRFRDVDRALSAVRHKPSAATGESVKDASLADWRLLPRTAAPLDKNARLFDARQGGGDGPPTRPDQTLADEMRLLLDSLGEVLQSLIVFKQSVEGARLMTSISIASEGRDIGISGAEVSNTNETAAPSGADEGSAAVEGGESTQRETLFAQLQCALRQLQQAEIASTAAVPSTNPKEIDSASGSRDAATMETVSAARERARRAGDKWLSLVSRVDVLHRIPERATSTDEQTHDAILAVVSPSYSTATAQSSLARTPLYSISVLDLLLSVFLRCLLFYVPALPYATRRAVVVCLAEPWVTQKQSVVVSRWMTLFAVKALFVASAVAAMGPSSSNISSSGVPSKLTTRSNDAADFAHLLSDHVTYILRTTVKLLRSLCWPTVFDYRATVVQRVFGLPQVVAQDAKTRSMEAENDAGIQHRIASSASVSVWRKAASVLESSVAHQSEGYALLLFFITVVDRVGVLDDTASLVRAHSSRRAGLSENQSSTLERDFDGHESCGAAHRTPWTTTQTRSFLSTCFLLMDTDRFISTRFYNLQRKGEFNTTSFFSLPSSPASPLLLPLPQAPSCTQTCALQTASLYGLARQTFFVFHQELIEAWPKAIHPKSQMLWDVFRCAVAAPAASVLYHTRKPSSGSAETAELAFVRGVAGTAEWQASAPVLRCFSRSATPAVWRTMWAYVSAELTSFPAQMRAMLLAARDKAMHHTSRDQTSSSQKRIRDAAGVQENDQDEDKATNALRACWTELSELALMCAWLLVAAEHAFVVKAPLSLEKGTHDVCGVMGELEDRVGNAFATCVKSVLAVWTEAGTTADAGRHLLELFTLRSACGSTEEEHNNPEKAPDALLQQLIRVFRAQVWTVTLENLVREWKTQMRLVQQQASTAACPPPGNNTGSADDAATTDHPAAQAANAAAAPTLLATAHCLQELADADPCILGWWRSLQAEDAGLPSIRVYLLQVFVELRRIVVSRRGQGKVQKSNSAARDSVVRTQTATSSEALAQPPKTERCEAPSLADATAARGGAEATEARLASDVLVEERDGGAEGGTEGTPLAASWSVFSPAELVVILRLLATISTRGGLTTANLSIRSAAKQRNTNASGDETFSASRAGSILDPLFRVALHNAMTTTVAATVSSSSPIPSEDASSASATEARGAAPVSSTAPDSVSDIVQVMEGIEKALLGSISANVSSLPAATLVEAAWLGLCSLSSLSEAFRAAGAPVDRRVTTVARETRTASSKWLEALHADVRTSTHTRLLCCFLLYRHYNVLCLGDGTNRLCSATAEVAYNHARPENCSQDATSTSTLADDACTPLLSLSKLFVVIRASCAEAIENVFEAATTTAVAAPDSNSSAASNKHNRVDADTEGGVRPKSAPSTSPKETVVAAAAVASPQNDEGSEAAASPLKAHASRFLQVFVLSSELHHRLSVQEACRVNSLTRDRGSCKPSNEMDEGKQRTLMHLYATLLAAVEAFLPFHECGSCTEVVQMMSILTCRMQELGVLDRDGALPLKNNNLTPSSTSGDGRDDARREGGASTRLVEPATTFTVSVPLHEESALMLDIGGSETANANSGRYLFQRYCTALQVLMPYVDAEVLAMSKRDVPRVLELVLVVSAKQAVERTMRGMLMTNGQMCSEPPTGQRDASIAPSASNTCTNARGERLLRKEDDTLIRALAQASSPSPRLIATACTAPSSSKPTPSFTSKRIWSMIPLEALLHRAIAAPFLAYRHNEQFCALATLAPELAAALLPCVTVWQDRTFAFHMDTLELGFLSAAACALAHHQRNQEEVYRRDSVPLLATALTSNGGGAPQDLTSSRDDRMTRSASHDSSSPTREREQAPSFSTLSSPTLRIGEVSMTDMPSCGELFDEEQKRQQYLPIYRSAGSLSTVRGIPPQLRRGWVALTRRLLETDTEGTVRFRGDDGGGGNGGATGSVSIWVAALYCGGVVGAAETQLFEQLLACFVFNPVFAKAKDGSPTVGDVAARQGAGEPRIAQLSATGWTLLIAACATASDHHYRNGYRALLKEELIDFLNQLKLRNRRDTAECPSSCFVQRISSSLGPALCGLFEALPKLFIENVEFWEGVVKRAVTRCCDDLSSVGCSSEGSRAVNASSLLVKEWTEQWKRSFNFAVTSVGHASLAFPDVWTDEDGRAAAEAMVERMEQSIRELKQAAPASVTVERNTGDVKATPHIQKSKYVPLETRV